MVTLDGNTLENIIDTDFTKVSNVSTPSWINSSPEIQPSIWSKPPQRIVYLIRVTDDLKWTLDQLLCGTSPVTLVDTTYDINDSVWVYSINAPWKGNEYYEKSWLLELELIKI